MEKIKVQFTYDEFKAFLTRTTVDFDTNLDYQELVNAIMPLEPYAYPAFRK